ncbi:hypothetical protein K2173_026325 [Erythroxylum novogranatense]|uniref:Uncharacterized protein n=1 Tax=Erythroxylum novogranatense TaxID=1862640 RepID=A0AAV8SNT1_9ROSI|nr:hypothetical protein K2173_026325 [Erythroxylum novogranatense]
MEQSKSNSNNNNGNHPAHSQLTRIKQESNFKIVDRSPRQPEVRYVLREITRPQLSRSPLGLTGRPISFHDS